MSGGFNPGMYGIPGRGLRRLTSAAGVGGLDPIPGAEDIDDFVTVIDGGGEVISTVAASGAAETIDLADGNVHDVTLTADCTFTFTSPASGRARSFTMFLRQGAGFPHLATWPGSVEWSAGTAPTLSTGSGDVDVLTFVTLDGGTVWYGFSAGGSSSSSGGEDVTFVDVPATGSTETIDCSDARLYHLFLDDDCTVTLTGSVVDEAHRLSILLQQDGTGGFTVTWPAEVLWPGGVTPTLTTDPGHTDWVDLITYDGGDVWYGVLNAADYATSAPAPPGGGDGTFPLLWLANNL